MDKIITKPPLDAKVARVDIVIETAVYAHNNVILNVHINLAAHPTIRAGRSDNAIRFEHLISYYSYCAKREG
jgi:hypothetical protein